MTTATLVTKADLEWCRKVASELIAGRTIEPSLPFYPTVNRTSANWGRNDPLPQPLVTGGAPFHGIIRLTLPDIGNFKVYADKKPGALDQLIRYAEGVVMHELTHFRQAANGIVNTFGPQKTGSAEEYFDTYYTNPLELEAHAAQIAYEWVLGLDPAQATPPLPDRKQVLATEIGRQISERIKDLEFPHPRHQDLEAFLVALTKDVQRHFAAFV